MAKTAILALLAGGIAAYIGRGLGPLAAIIGILMTAALFSRPLVMKLLKNDKWHTTLFIFLLLFEIGGFTCLAYPSIPEAVSFYGDFHDVRIYKNIATRNITQMAPFIVLPIEARIASFALLTKDDGTLLIFLSLINRLIALILLFLIGKELARSDGIALMGTYAFVFSYRLIPFTQGMKFVAGMPFLLLWLLLAIRQEKTGKTSLLAQTVTFLLATLSEQWIASFIVIMFIFHTLIKMLFGKKMFVSETYASVCIAAAAMAWYYIEQARLIRGDFFLLTAFPEFAFPSVTIPPFFSIALIITAFMAIRFVWRGKRDTEAALTSSVITLIFISAVYGIIRIGSVQSYIASMSPMLLVNAILTLLTVSPTPITFAVLFAMATHYLMPYAGILIMQSPYIASLAAPFTVFSLSEKKNAMRMAWLFIVLSGTLFIWQFLEYIHGWNAAVYVMPWLLAFTLLSHLIGGNEKKYAS